MAQLKIRDLHELLRQAPRRRDLEQDGIRLVYDGTALLMSTADAPDTVIARADTCGFTTEPWDVTAYRASITSTEVWLRTLNAEHGDHLIDVAPFWAQRPAAITFTAGGHTAAFPTIACPTAPAAPPVAQPPACPGSERLLREFCSSWCRGRVKSLRSRSLLPGGPDVVLPRHPLSSVWAPMPKIRLRASNVGT